MQPTRRRWRQVLGVFAALLLALVLVLRTERAGAFVCEQLRERLPAAIDAQVELGRCAIDPLNGSVEVSRIVVTATGASAPFITADKAAVSLRGLFFGGVSLQDVELIRPSVALTLPLAGGAGGTTCPVRELSRLRVNRLRVDDASVALTLPEGRLVRLDGVMIDASIDRREAVVTVDGRGGAVVVGDQTLRLGKLVLEATLDLGAEQLDVQRAEANLEGVRVTTSGTVDALCGAPSLDLAVQAWLPLEALPRLGVPLPTPSGQVLARASVGGKLDALAVHGEVQGSRVILGPYAPGDFSARASWTGKVVKLEEFLTRSGDGEVRVSGELSLEQGLPVTARIETKDASFARIMARAGVPGAWVEFAATVKGTVTGNLSPTPVLGGDIEFHTGRFVLAARAWDGPPTAGIDILGFKQSSGRFRLGVTSQVVSFDDVAIRVGAAEATRVSGMVKLFPQRNAIDADVTADAIDLSDFGSASSRLEGGSIAELPWAGFGQARVAVKGPFASVVVEGQTTLRDFKLAGYSLGVTQSPLRYQGGTLAFPAIAAQKGQTQYFGDVALNFNEPKLHARATVQLPDGRVEDVIDLLADLSPAMQNLQDRVLTGRMSALAAFDCPVSELTGVIAARVRDGRYLERRLGEANLIARFEAGQTMVLEPTVFDGPLGRFAVDGTWDFDGPLDYRLALEGGSLAELIDPGGEQKLPVSGAFVAKGKVSGTTDVTVIDGWMSSSDVTWKQHVLGPMHLEAKAVGRELEASGTVFPGLGATLGLSMRNDWPFRSHLDVQIADLAPFLPESAASVAVRLKGTVDAHGPMRDFRQVTARATLSELGIARGEVTAANVEPVELAWNAGAIEVASLELKGPTTELTAAGTWGPVNVDLKTRGSVDLRLLSSLTNQLERTQGRLDFTAAFAGSVAAPSLAGRASLTDARFQVRGQDLAVRALSGRADFSESRILIQDVQGFLNEGRVRARGDVRLERFSIKTLELQTDLEDVSVQVKPDVPVTLTGSLLLASRNAEQFQLSGGLDVVKFRYTQPMALESLVATAREVPVPNDTKPNEWLRLDVDLRTAGDVRIENNLARARLAGRLKLSGTNVKPVLIGVVETQEGAQAFFRGNTFNVQRGQLQFNGLWPTFDLSAQSQVREYLVTVKAFGRFEDPKLSLSSEPPLSDADILSLLTLGVTSREQLTGTSAAGLGAEALLSASGLDQQVQKFLSQSGGLLKDPQVRLTTSFNEASGTAEPAVTLESKVLIENLKVGVTKPVAGRGTKAHLDYRFNQHVSARAQWDDQNQNTTLGNPGVELRFRFEWE
ncbi:MAG: translocation/assembly module TamB domain-containing protein [Archangium sp.]|nr:translocation/assembly module TamB domain-containing protein [Archangium sp.]